MTELIRMRTYRPRAVPTADHMADAAVHLLGRERRPAVGCAEQTECVAATARGISSERLWPVPATDAEAAAQRFLAANLDRIESLARALAREAEAA